MQPDFIALCISTRDRFLTLSSLSPPIRTFKKVSFDTCAHFVSSLGNWRTLSDYFPSPSSSFRSQSERTKKESRSLFAFSLSLSSSEHSSCRCRVEGPKNQGSKKDKFLLFFAPFIGSSSQSLVLKLVLLSLLFPSQSNNISLSWFNLIFIQLNSLSLSLSSSMFLILQMLPSLFLSFAAMSDIIEPFSSFSFLPETNNN